MPRLGSWFQGCWHFNKTHRRLARADIELTDPTREENFRSVKALPIRRLESPYPAEQAHPRSRTRLSALTEPKQLRSARQDQCGHSSHEIRGKALMPQDHTGQQAARTCISGGDLLAPPAAPGRPLPGTCPGRSSLVDRPRLRPMSQTAI